MPVEQTVYIVDDDDSVRESLSFLLTSAGIATSTFPSATAFVAALPLPRPGCIITDIRMPEMSGLDLVGKLHSLGVELPVIVMTGHADVAMAIQALQAGVADFIEKPFCDESILDAVRAALSKQATGQENAIERENAVQRMAALSRREREVMDGLVEGKANKVIAYDLGISARTVEVYRANVMTKMQVRTVSDLVRLVMIARLTS